MDEDPSPFFEPLLRSFLLGLGAGAIFESLHVCMKVRPRVAAATPRRRLAVCQYSWFSCCACTAAQAQGVLAQDSWSAFL